MVRLPQRGRPPTAPMMLAAESIQFALAYELYRIGGRANVAFGSPGELSLPGGKPARIEWAGQPEANPSIENTFKLGVKMQSDILRGVRAPAAPMAETIVERQAAGEDHRTAAQIKLADLLKQQMSAAEDVSEAGEQRYQAIVAEVAQAQAVVDAERAAGATK
jgi:hypothetical protein